MSDAEETVETDLLDAMPKEDPSPEGSRFLGNSLNRIITLGVVWLVVCLLPQLTHCPKRRSGDIDTVDLPGFEPD